MLTNFSGRLTRLLAGLAFAFALVACDSDSGDGDARFVSSLPQPDNPTVQGPIEGGGAETCCRITLLGFEIDLRLLGYVPGTPFYTFLEFDEAELGYRETEYFFSGTAVSYVTTDEPASDGRWSVQAADAQPYTSRMIVQRPVDDAAFNGTVVVEWLNVTAGLDSAIVWTMAHTEMVREGYAWVGISAQSAGVEGGGAFDLPLKGVDTERYGALVHPGDSFSYDIFSQGAQAVRRPLGVDPLQGLEVKRMLAVGQSQSASRLVTYINTLSRDLDLFDGFLVQSRSRRAAPISQAPLVEIPAPEPALLREDTRQPVLVLQAENDLSGLGLQPDASRLRFWEVAGSAHSDAYVAVKGRFDRGDDPGVAEVIETPEARPPFINCPKPVNDGPMHWVLKAALASLDRWAATTQAAPMAPRLRLNADADELERDPWGNALGGIRTPWVDAPVARLTGYGNSDGLCFLFGVTELFDEARLAQLYPTQADYVDAVERSADAAEADGFLRPADVALIKAWARESGIGGIQ